MLVSLFALLLALGALAAGAGYVAAARRMRRFVSTKGKVIAREVVVAPGMSTREGVYGDGGGYMARARYRYSVDGVERESDRMAYAIRGYKRAVAERMLARIPDEVVVWYDPARPEEAYLEKHASTFGWVLVAGGLVGAIAASASVVAHMR